MQPSNVLNRGHKNDPYVPQRLEARDVSDRWDSLEESLQALTRKQEGHSQRIIRLETGLSRLQDELREEHDRMRQNEGAMEQTRKDMEKTWDHAMGLLRQLADGGPGPALPSNQNKRGGHPDGSKSAGPSKRVRTPHGPLAVEARRFAPAVNDSRPSAAVAVERVHRYPEVEFDEVYQNGHAVDHYFIIAFPKDSTNWFIIRCAACGMRFSTNPLNGGGTHIHSARHNIDNKTFKNVVKHLGIRVLSCDAEKVERNNQVATEGIQLDDGQKITTSLRLVPGTAKYNRLAAGPDLGSLGAVGSTGGAREVSRDDVYDVYDVPLIDAVANEIIAHQDGPGSGSVQVQTHAQVGSVPSLDDSSRRE